MEKKHIQVVRQNKNTSFHHIQPAQKTNLHKNNPIQTNNKKRV